MLFTKCKGYDKHVCRKYRVLSFLDSACIVFRIGPNYDATIYSTVGFFNGFRCFLLPASVVTFGMTVIWRRVHVDLPSYKMASDHVTHVYISYIRFRTTPLTEHRCLHLRFPKLHSSSPSLIVSTLLVFLPVFSDLVAGIQRPDRQSHSAKCPYVVVLSLCKGSWSY